MRPEFLNETTSIPNFFMISKFPHPARAFTKLVLQACSVAHLVNIFLFLFWHKRKTSFNETRLLSTEHLKTMSLKELNRPTFCATHTDERLALFCDTCNVSICRDCALTDHRKHNTQFVEDAYSKLRPRLSNVLEQTRNICVKVENAIPVLDWIQARVNIKADGVLRDIEDSINGKIKALEQRKSELRAAVELVRVNRKTALEIQRKRLEASRDTLQVSCRFAKRVLEEGNCMSRYSIYGNLL